MSTPTLTAYKMDSHSDNKNLGNSVLPQGLQNTALNLPVPAFLQQNHHASQHENQQSVIAHIQQMLDTLSARGMNSMLVTVDPLGDISIHGSQKGQHFLKDNSDVAERFAKICSDDVWTLLGAQKRFLEIGRQQQGKQGLNDKGDYPIDFSHERGNYFPPHSGSSDRSVGQDTFVQGILSQSNPSKSYQPNSFLHSSFGQFDSRSSTGPFFQGGFNQAIPGSDSFPQPPFMPGLDAGSGKDAYHNNPSNMLPSAGVSSQGAGSSSTPSDKTNGISQSEADLIKEMLTSTPVQDVINTSIKPEKEKSSKSASKSEGEKSSKKADSEKRKRERRPETWQRNIKKKLKCEGKEYVNAKGKLIPAKKMLPIDCSKCKQKCTDKISEETRMKIFDWFWKLGSYTAQKEFVVSRVTQVATKTSKRRHVHRLFSFEINGKYESVCKPFFSRTLGVGDSYIYKAFEQKARDLFVHDGRGKHSPANKTAPEQVAFMHEHLDRFLVEYDINKPLPKNIHAQKWYEEYEAICSENDSKPVSKHIYRKIFQEYVRKFPSSPDKKKGEQDTPPPPPRFSAVGPIAQAAVSAAITRAIEEQSASYVPPAKKRQDFIM